MKLVSLVVIIFPVTVAMLALIIGYFMRQVENRIGNLKLAVESDTNIMHSSSMFTFRTGTLAKAHHKIESNTAL